MSTIKYHKLVRDRIPEIIAVSGKTCITEILSDEDYLKMLDAKLDEELAEYHKDQNIEELADLLEVIRACAVARGYSLDQLEQVRAEKATKRGGFEKKILLKGVIDGLGGGALVDRIVENQGIILSKLDVPMMKTYYWLIDNLHTRDISVDAEYRRKFSGYYRMRFVSQEYRDAFFTLFEKIKTDKDIPFEAVSTELFSVDQKHEFSFISKMLHTINSQRPIYDSQVHDALRIHRPYYSDFSKKLQQDSEILKQISGTYRELESSPKMADVLSAFDRVVPERTMSVEKKLDFILWALGAI